jgi:hypothetical protein
VRYWSISPAEPITPRVRVCGGSWGGTDEDDDGEVGEVGDVAALEAVCGPLAPEEPEESQAARRPLASTPAHRRATTRRAVRSGYRPDVARTAEP